MNPLEVKPENIWQFRQNRVGLVVRDLQELAGVEPKVTARVLMARGVFKWLAARRDLIKLKNKWRSELTVAYRTLETMKRGTPEYYELRGRVKALEFCRRDVRKICHSERWRASDIEPKEWEAWMQ